MTIKIPRLPMDSFDWLRWLRGIDIWEVLGIKANYYDIRDNSEIMRTYAIGYIPSERLTLRCKAGEMSVLFLINDEFCWTHLRIQEFEDIFCA